MQHAANENHDSAKANSTTKEKKVAALTMRARISYRRTAAIGCGGLLTRHLRRRRTAALLENAAVGIRGRARPAPRR
jgi:hypothetical protein